PHLSRIAGADLDLSVETTLFLAKLVALSAPVTARLMLHVHHIELHELTFIAQLLVLQLLPYLAGRQVRKHWPTVAERLDRPLRIAMLTCFVAVLALLVAGHRLRAILALPFDRGWWAVLLYAVTGLLLGWLVGGPAPAARRALAISANARDL